MNYQIVAIIAFVSIFVLESIFPYHKEFLGKGRFVHFGRNSVLALINSLLTILAGALVVTGLFLWVEEKNVGLLNQLPLEKGSLAILAFIIYDLWIYTWHRINHQISFFWRFHRVHHTDPAMDLSTSLRFHPIEILFSTMIIAILVLLVGFRVEHIVCYKFVFHSIVYFHHSNIAFPEKIDRILRWVIVTPNMHRVHHSTVREETDSNFASVFAFWDRIFGTYRERDTHDIHFGLDRFMEEQWQTVKGLLKLPFQNVNKD